MTLRGTFKSQCSAMSLAVPHTERRRLDTGLCALSSLQPVQQDTLASQLTCLSAFFLLQGEGGRCFSRAEPRHKQDIVRLLKEMGEVGSLLSPAALHACSMSCMRLWYMAGSNTSFTCLP